MGPGNHLITWPWSGQLESVNDTERLAPAEPEARFPLHFSINQTDERPVLCPSEFQFGSHPYNFKEGFSKLGIPQGPLEASLRAHCRLHVQWLWFSRSGWGPRICISHKFPGAAAAGLRTTLWELQRVFNQCPVAVVTYQSGFCRETGSNVYANKHVCKQARV